MSVEIEEMRLKIELLTDVSRFKLGCKVLPQNSKVTINAQYISIEAKE